MIHRRIQRGATLALVVACIVVIAIISVAAVFLVQLFGGGEQVQRSADAGNLAIARNALVGVGVSLPAQGVNAQFNGVADNNGQINLRNYNRATAQAFLVAANAATIVAQGQDNGAAAHAKGIQQAVQSLGDQLTNQLTQPGALNQFFTALSSLNPTGDFGKNSQLSPTGATQVAFMNRGQASNVYVTPNQMPDSVNGNSAMWNNGAAGWTTQVSTPSGVHNYFVGYKDGITPDPTIANSYFVSLRPGTMPNLVSGAVFSANTNPGQGQGTFNWDKSVAVPNGLSMTGQAKSSASNTSSSFTAYALVAPIDPNGFAAAIPHGFVRLMNGPVSPASGVAAGSQDVFAYVMNDNQYYVTDKNGKPLPYFVGPQNVPSKTDPKAYLQSIISANQAGTKPDCSFLSVGLALAGDSVGLNGVSQPNCANIAGIRNAQQPFDNNDLDNPSSQANTDMAAYNNNDSRNLWARPLLEAAYDISPPQPTGSNGGSVNVADIVNLNLLSQRAQGNDATFSTYQSGIANIPANRAPLNSPNFRVTTDQGVMLNSTNVNGLKKGGPIWTFLVNRCYQINPNFNGDLDAVLSQDFVPMGGRAYVYYSTKANGGLGGLTLKNEAAALADAPWLSTFISEKVDSKQPVHPTETKAVSLANDSLVDLAGDWGFPHPFDGEGQICITNWFAFTPSSGWNNLLGEVTMGAITTNCNPGCGTVATDAANFTINYNANNDTVSMPGNCMCDASGGGSSGGSGGSGGGSSGGSGGIGSIFGVSKTPIDGLPGTGKIKLDLGGIGGEGDGSGGPSFSPPSPASGGGGGCSYNGPC